MKASSKPNKPAVRAIFLRLLSTITIALAVSCTTLPEPAGWHYKNPPQTGTKTNLSDREVWCLSVEGAQFMAITGWFASDCQPGPLTADQLNGPLKIVGLTHYVFEAVKLVLVECRDNERSYWVPLPDHHWI